MMILGVDMGGTKIKLGLIKEGEVAGICTIPSRENEGIEQALIRIDEEGEALLSSLGLNKNSLDGIGIGFPGIVDFCNNKVLSTPKYSDAIDFDFNKWVSSNFSIPLRMDNDSRLACLGEWKTGAGRGVDDLIMVTLGTGFGSSAVMNGSLIRGTHFHAGILGGHSPIDFKGAPCVCGNRGCVETLASSWALGSLTETEKDQYPYHGKADYYSIFKAARAGDPGAGRLASESLNAWGAAVVNLIHAYDPALVVLGGGVMNSGDYIIPVIKTWIEEHAWLSWGMVEIKQSSLGDRAALIGAFSLFSE